MQAQEGAPVVSVIKPVPHVGGRHQPGSSNGGAAHQADRRSGGAQQLGSSDGDAQQAASNGHAVQQPASSSGGGAQQADSNRDSQQPAGSIADGAQPADSSSTANEVQAAWVLWQDLQELLTVQRYWWKETVFR